MSRFKVYVTPAAWREIKELPGHVRQRVKRAVEALSADPQPSGSKALTCPGVQAEVRRLRLDQWRLLYAVSQEEEIIDILAVRKRPPYDYGDLSKMLEDIN